jgi:hypothetical protein
LPPDISDEWRGKIALVIGYTCDEARVTPEG